MLDLAVLGVAYGAMVVSQVFGAEIIGFLWGPEAQQAAIQSSISVQPDLSYQQLCQGYVAAHYDFYSNMLHIAGMLGALMLLILGLPSHWNIAFAKTSQSAASTTSRFTAIRLWAWIFPVYYLTAWTGHFVFQKDIPAVFTYATTVPGWIKGEACAWEHLLGEIKQAVAFQSSGTEQLLEIWLGALLAIVIVAPIVLFLHPVPNETRNDKWKNG